MEQTLVKQYASSIICVNYDSTQVHLITEGTRLLIDFANNKIYVQAIDELSEATMLQTNNVWCTEL